MLELIAVLLKPVRTDAPTLRVRCSECGTVYRLKAWLSHLRRVERCSDCANKRRRGQHYGLAPAVQRRLRKISSRSRNPVTRKV